MAIARLSSAVTAPRTHRVGGAAIVARSRGYRGSAAERIVASPMCGRLYEAGDQRGMTRNRDGAAFVARSVSGAALPVISKSSDGKIPENNHFDGFIDLDGRIAGNDGEPVGADHRRQDRRALV